MVVMVRTLGQQGEKMTRTGAISAFIDWKRREQMWRQVRMNCKKYNFF